MSIIFHSDGKGMKLEVSIQWKSVKAILKALLVVISTLITFLATPEIHRLGTILGLW